MYNGQVSNIKGEVRFGEVVGRVSGMAGGRVREGVVLLLSGWLMSVVE